MAENASSKYFSGLHFKNILTVFGLGLFEGSGMLVEWALEGRKGRRALLLHVDRLHSWTYG